MWAARFLHLPDQRRFQVIRIHHHLASGNLLVRSAVITQFTDSQPVFRSHRRTKRAASHRPRIVKLAQSRLRIEHRTRLVVAEFREALRRLRTVVENFRVKHTRFRVAWKPRCQPPHRISSPRANPSRSPGVRLCKTGQSLLQSHRIQLMDGKHTHAALRASRTAHQPLPAAPSRIGQSRIYDLEERAIPTRQSAQRHVGRISHRANGSPMRATGLESRIQADGSNPPSNATKPAPNSAAQ